MSTDFIKNQELDFTEDDVINATLVAIIELLDNIGDVEPKHLKNYVKSIVMLMDMITDDETEIILDDMEEDDQDHKDFLNKLDEYKLIKILKLENDE